VKSIEHLLAKGLAATLVVGGGAVRSSSAPFART
jgi:hypothetical protein